MFKYNSRNVYHKAPFGAVKSESVIHFCIEAEDGVFIHDIFLCVFKDGESVKNYPMHYVGKRENYSIFSVDIELKSVGLYWYYFSVNSEKGNFNLYKGQNADISYEGALYQITVYDKEFSTPQKMKGGVIYHIFVDRFYRSNDSEAVFAKSGVLKEWNEPVTIVDSDGVFRANDFYGGNLRGIIEKLDYLKSLGVTMIYLSPIFKSSSNHRYDTGDYMQIDELLGSEKTFEELIEKAKSYGIGIMLDGVFNHTGSDSLYFNKFGNYNSIGAYESKESPYYDWYYFNNFPDDYGCWWGITVTPTVNKNNLSYRKFIFGKNGVLDKWCHKGIEGLRLDVVDELDIDFVNEINTTVKSIDNNITIIGEVWEDASNKIAYSQRRPYLLGHQLDGVMNYPFKNAILKFCFDMDSISFIDSIMTIYENYPLDALNSSMTFLGTHDTVRAINSLAGVDISNTTKQERLYYKLNDNDRKNAKERLIFASTLQYVLPGVPSIFYGDEVGLEGYEDPINRKPFPWNDMDNQLLEHYIELGNIRSIYKNAFKGEMNIYTKNEYLYIERYNNEEKISLMVNLVDNNQNIIQVNSEDVILYSHNMSSECINKASFMLLYTKNV